MTHQDKLQQLRLLREQLVLAEEQLMTADNASERWAAGNAYDRIEAAIEDLQASF